VSAPPRERAAAAPRWFREALASAPQRAQVRVGEVGIATRVWGEPGDPGVVLVHGGAAHARWWDHLAPLLARGHRVAALDLSGHGDSGRRQRYGLEAWADEVLAVAEAAGMREPPVLVGHSMGGFVAMAAAALHGEQLGGAVIVDAPVRRPDPESQEGRHGRMFRRPKTYPDLDSAVAHFHLVPDQPPPEPYVLEHVARHSLRRVPDGWTWKFDPQVFVRRDDPSPHDFGDLLERVRCRVAVLHGELSGIVDTDVTDYMFERLGRAAPFVEIPQAHHHLLLDQPLAFVAALRALLADWAHSAPHRIPGLTRG
jgi:pimeloyl-ACP methyl ester carboxylesterase